MACSHADLNVTTLENRYIKLCSLKVRKAASSIRLKCLMQTLDSNQKKHCQQKWGCTRRLVWRQHVSVRLGLTAITQRVWQRFAVNRRLIYKSRQMNVTNGQCINEHNMSATSNNEKYKPELLRFVAGNINQTEHLKTCLNLFLMRVQ